MIEHLRSWLNGEREYWRGVILYDSFGDNAALKGLLHSGESAFNFRKLNESLEEIWETSQQRRTPIEAPVAEENKELVAACRLTADKEFKRVMNDRAILFRMANVKSAVDVNRQDLIEARSAIAMDVVEGYRNVSQLYDEVDYVRQTGRLPERKEQEGDVNLIPDVLVKQTLDNLRKNTNKLKKREQTPDRVALIQKHQKDIDILYTRWQKLKLDE